MDYKSNIKFPSLFGSAARVAFLYALFGIVWILIGDWLVSLLAVDARHGQILQNVKGLVFVTLSAVLIFILVYLQNRVATDAVSDMLEERRRLAGIIEGTQAGTWEWHIPSGRTVFNARWAEILGYTLKELAPISIETWEKATHPDDLRHSKKLMQRHFDGELDYYEYEYRMRHKDGHWVWVLDRGRLISRTTDGRPLLMLGIHVDITLRKQYEMETLRMNRLYATLGETNETIVRITDQQSMFQKICDIAVEHGGFSLAWIGLPDETNQHIEVVASSGETGYLDGLMITIDPERSESHGPTARAYHSGSWQVINDFEHNPMTRPWHERAQRYEVNSSAAFPLRQDDKVIGVLNIYARETDFFQEHEIALLEKMAADISFGIENYHRVLLLSASERRFHAIADSISDAILMANPQREIQWLNPGFEHIFGYTLDELRNKETNVLYENQEEYLLQGQLRFNREAGAREDRYVVRYRRKNGEIFLGETMGTTLRSESDELLGYVALIRDVTEQRLTEEQLRIAAAAFEVENGIMITNRDMVIERINKAFTRITGYELEEVIGKTPSILRSGQHDQSFYMKMWQEINTLGYWEGEIWNRNKAGEIYPEWLTISAVKDEQGEVTHYIGSFTDMSERKEAERHIHQLAFYDPLTHLANRRLFIDRVDHARQTSERTRQYGAILMLDLDHFKVLNDTQGHHAGDELLIEVGKRLREKVRESDTVSRFGGDEFVILLEDLSSDNDAAVNLASSVAEKIHEELQLPYQLMNIFDYRITSSIGVVLFSGENASVQELLKQADVALYEAKECGRNSIRFYNPEMQLKVQKRAETEAALVKALENNEFLLHYQPQVDRNGRLVGAEALLRWKPQDKDIIVPPAEFISLAEDTGQIVPIGYWVLETACQQLSEWQRRYPDSEFDLAVNISARQFHQENFVSRLQDIIKGTGIDPRGLKLELTESVVLDNIYYVLERLDELKTMGISTSMDDFGTGYSSLSYLKVLPIEQIKIDTSFISDITRSSDDSAIVRTIIAMGHSLGLQIVAEGVETREQSIYLEKYNCDIFQGYLYGKPLPITGFEQEYFKNFK